jgi:hypothetical protein
MSGVVLAAQTKARAVRAGNRSERPQVASHADRSDMCSPRREGAGSPGNTRGSEIAASMSIFGFAVIRALRYFRCGGYRRQR